MSVPLDRLYHYLGDCVNHDLVIYRWAPHGSRKLKDLTQLTNYPEYQWYNNPIAIFHDQEPLKFDLWTKQQFYNQAAWWFEQGSAKFMLTSSILAYTADLHLRGAMALVANVYDLTILIHSEQQSQQVNVFRQNGFVPVYYWCHAVIALDWFRYAANDPKLDFDNKEYDYDFLIYNRAWSGTREYRLCFADKLISADLVKNCKTSFNPVDQEQHYTKHNFLNRNFFPQNSNIESWFDLNTHSASHSADYNSEDYSSAGIEIVLETLFDDTRWHLTEKTLRPIACGKPFILAATPGSLQYLRNYGFETFAEYINESYDQIVDGCARLDAVIQEMKRIAGLDTGAKQVLYTKLHEIAQRNKKRFFNGLFDQVIEEYKTNLDRAMIVMQQHCTGKHRTETRRLLQQN
jgi:hypothetical protein